MSEDNSRSPETGEAKTKRHMNDKKNALAYLVFVLAAACMVMSVLFVYMSSYSSDTFDVDNEVKNDSAEVESYVQQLVSDFYDNKYQELGNKYYTMELKNYLRTDEYLKDLLSSYMLDCRVTAWADPDAGLFADTDPGMKQNVLYDNTEADKDYRYSYSDTGDVVIRRQAYKQVFDSFEEAEAEYRNSRYYNEEAYGYNIYPVELNENTYGDVDTDSESVSVSISAYGGSDSDGSTDLAGAELQEYDATETDEAALSESRSDTVTEEAALAESQNSNVVTEESTEITDSIDSTEEYVSISQYELEIYYFTTVKVNVETALNVPADTLVTNSYPYYISNTSRFNRYNKLSLVMTLISIVCMLISAVVIILRTVRYSRYNRTGERIPAEIYYAEMACGVFIIAAAYNYISYNYGWFYILAAWPARYIVTLIAAFGIAVAFIAFISMMSLQLLVKNYCNGVVADHSIIVRIFRWVKRCLRAVGQFLRYVGERITFITRAILFYMLLTIVEIIILFIVCGYSMDSGVIIAIYVLVKIMGIVAFVTLAVELYELYKGGVLLAEGDTDHRVNTKYMFWLFRRHGENLNKIQDGIERAVEDKMKSERMKTELITNVSHDIKTPLTSIINYTDLLDKQNIQDDTAKGYIDVLKRQSLRLKKLIEDLVEASKASTGNLEVNKELMDANLLLNQAVAEYGDRIEGAGLELVVTNSETPAYIVADGRHLWRVFDNMLGNICKYAMPNTRVYVDVTKTDKKVEITFKNISRDKLNISADELMERFVRGDQSRNTEGSGLGLSIAKSLCDIMDGRFEIDIDGDLYKAIVVFHREDADEDEDSSVG